MDDGRFFRGKNKHSLFIFSVEDNFLGFEASFNMELLKINPGARCCKINGNENIEIVQRC